MPALDRALTSLRAVDWRREGWRDVACAIFLLSVTWHLTPHDGGKPLASLLPGLLLGVGVLAATTRELARRRTFTRWLLVAWSLGPVVALAAGEVRAGWVRPTAALALAVPAYLAALHLWRRPKGPVVLGVLLAAAAARAWWGAFLAYWGGSGGNAWLALSWHNQSATLMGALGLFGFGMVAAGRRRWVQGVGLALAAAGGAGVWLAASRAALILTLVGLGAAATAAVARRPVLRVGTSVAGTLLASAAVTGALGLLAEGPGAGAERLVERGLDRGNLMVRFDYWQGAWGMVLQEPLTGTGPGSYQWASLPHASRNTSRTATAHNEYLEALAEQGVLGGLPVWVAALAAAWLVLRTLVRPRGGAPEREAGSVAGSGRHAGTVAAVGVLTLLGLHAGFDFDWDYPILLVTAAVAVGVLSGRRDAPCSWTLGSSAWTVGSRAALGSAALCLVLSAVGVEASNRAGGPPWALDAPLRLALEAAEEDRPSEARALLRRVERWNPGAPTLPAVSALVSHHAGGLSHPDLAERASRFPSMDHRILAAEQLASQGAWTEARTALEGLRAFIQEHRRWQVRTRIVRVVGLRLEVMRREGGCPAARAGWADEVEWAGGFGVDAEALVSAIEQRPELAACLQTEAGASP